MDWSNILSIPPNELTLGVLEAIPNHLSSVDANQLSVEELRNFFELSRFLINRLSTDGQKQKTLGKGQLKWSKGLRFFPQFHRRFFSINNFRLDVIGDKKLLKGGDTDETYYIQTIQEVTHFFIFKIFAFCY